MWKDIRKALINHLTGYRVPQTRVSGKKMAQCKKYKTIFCNLRVIFRCEVKFGGNKKCPPLQPKSCLRACFNYKQKRLRKYISDSCFYHFDVRYIYCSCLNLFNDLHHVFIVENVVLAHPLGLELDTENVWKKLTSASSLSSRFISIIWISFFPNNYIWYNYTGYIEQYISLETIKVFQSLGWRRNDYLCFMYLVPHTTAYLSSLLIDLWILSQKSSTVDLPDCSTTGAS